jgi:hypothetical protein
MTHDILQSDIELATRLRADQRPDEEIIRALVNRGIDPGLAAQLADDLRSGRKITARSALPPELNLRRRSRAASPAPETGERPPTRSPAARSHSQPAAALPRQRQKGSRLLTRISLALAGLAFVVLAFVVFLHFQQKTFSLPEPAAPTPNAGGTPPAAPAAAAPVRPSGAGMPLVLEMRPDGLRIRGSLVTRNNLLPAISNLLGPPNRTNQIASTGVGVYAYDHLGLLIYSQPGGATNSIALDCEATGTVNGTTSPFAGLLKMEDRVIGPDVDSAKLTAISELGLTHPGGSDNVWSGRYHDLGLAFAYLKTTRRPSLIVIDLK